VWGKRTLAYEIKHKREGFYLFWQFEAPGSAITALEYRLRLSDQVLRFLTVNLDQELRRKRKFDVIRAERKARPKPAGETGARVPGGEA
jgi:small subunit ribosomal protein S6